MSDRFNNFRLTCGKRKCYKMISNQENLKTYQDFCCHRFVTFN
ncbi:hypothetical protein HMPREF0541_02036 [Lacticaseibacillus rhamnosus ATCC 21052]|nr:hypothetical protein HMPREF0541_02036 [Lacticaseibacillus rhamnosus ATCC 21052]